MNYAKQGLNFSDWLEKKGLRTVSTITLEGEEYEIFMFEYSLVELNEGDQLDYYLHHCLPNERRMIGKILESASYILGDFTYSTYHLIKLKDGGVICCHEESKPVHYLEEVCKHGDLAYQQFITDNPEYPDIRGAKLRDPHLQWKVNSVFICDVTLEKPQDHPLSIEVAKDSILFKWDLAYHYQ